MIFTVANSARLLSLSPGAAAPGAEGTGRRGAGEWAQPAAFPGLADEFERLKPQMAMQFPFELDGFQKARILCLTQPTGQRNATAGRPRCI